MQPSRLRPRTAWVINDSVTGVFFQQLRRSGFEVLRCTDSRALNSSNTAQINLLEDLKLSRPALLCGMLRAPATHVGTSVERNFSQRLSDLLVFHGQQGGGFVFLGPMQNRLLDQPGLRTLGQQGLARQKTQRWCCLGVR